MTYTCDVIERKAQPTLGIRMRCGVQDLQKKIPESYKALFEYLEQTGQEMAGAPYAAYFNMDMQNLDVEAGVPVAMKLPGKGDIQPGEVSAGKAAACTHVGPYGTLPAAYEALGRWMAQQKLEGDGTTYEIYLNDPQEVSPEELETQIVMPLKRK